MLGYVIATPSFNEREALPDLLAAMDAQRVRPAVWVIVDDGSTDGSREWLDDQVKTRSWVVVLDSPERAEEYLGAHVARIKRWGLERALEIASERGVAVGYGGILDADLVPPPEHYARLIEEFESNPRLGVTSSLIQAVGHAEVERFQRDELPRGGTQFFTLECLRAIGGIPPWPGFDGAANVLARLRGFETRLVRELVTLHKRETGTRFGAAQGYERKGRYAYFLGVHPVLVAGRTVAYSFEPPFLRGVYFAKGYAGDWIQRRPRCPDPEVRRAYGTDRLKQVVKHVWRRVVR